MLESGWDAYCGAEEHAEAWTVTASTCDDVPDGYYVATGRAEHDTCPGWDACTLGAYSDEVGKSLEDTDWAWQSGGCEGVTCHGLPFFIVDDNHPTADGSCTLQCTAGPPDGEGKASAECTGDNVTCTFDYVWTDQP
jgi:hypothetical protein